ncbi:MAG: heavy-metal-associated domain-containing protein [Bacteroidales bacterium]|nr:MAG: heavy-metal-associated domain-containing protein [Bacteroidales bacterium]
MKVFGYLLAGFIACSLIVGMPKAIQAQKKDEVKEVTISATLHCKSCQKKVEREIAFEKGVKSVTTNLEEKTVTIKYDASKNTDEKLADAIKKLGYEVKILKTEEKKKESK